jgi:hypothetical protein
MTIRLNKSTKLNLKRHIIFKINYYIYIYKNKYDIQSIYFNSPIDGIEYFNSRPYNTNTEKYLIDWEQAQGSTLVKILNCLKSKDFYGYCKTTEGKLVKIIPKKDKNELKN